MQAVKEFYLKWRRTLLKTLVPEFVWRKTVRLDGVEIPVRHTPFSFGTRLILQNGTYEEPERKLLAAILRPGMQVLEMGSSIGVVTAIIAEKIGPTGKIVAIEASESLVSFSSTWLSRYPQLQLIHGIAFPVARVLALKINSFNEARGNLGGVVAFENGILETSPDERVWDIDRVCSTCNLQPELMVVDIEGSEAIMGNTPLQFPISLEFILIEFHPGLMPGGNKDVDSIKAALEKEGFSLRESSYTVSLYTR